MNYVMSIQLLTAALLGLTITIQHSAHAELLTVKIKKACNDESLGLKMKAIAAGQLAQDLERKLVNEISKPQIESSAEAQQFQAADEEIMTIKARCLHQVLAGTATDAASIDQLWNLVGQLRDPAHLQSKKCKRS